MDIDLKTLRYPERFHEMCNLLVLAEFSDAKTVEGRGGDEGVDCFIGTFHSPNIIFQHKYFVGRIKHNEKKQICNSLQRACQKRPQKWILLIATDFTPSEQRWFESLQRKYPNTKIDYWGASKITRFLEKYEEIRQKFFPDEVKKAVRELTSSIEQTLARIQTKNVLYDVKSLLRKRNERIAEIDQMDLEIADILMRKEGNLKAAKEHFIKVYERSKIEKNLTSELSAIVGLTSVESRNPNPSLEVLNICDSGIMLAKERGNFHFEAVLKANKACLIFALAARRMINNFFLMKIHEKKGDLPLFYNELAMSNHIVNSAIRDATCLFEEAQELSVQNKDARGLAAVLLSKAFILGYLVYVKKTHFEKDFEQLLQSTEKIYSIVAEMYESLRDEESLAALYSNKTVLYWSLNLPDKVEKYALAAIDLANKHNLKSIIDTCTRVLKDAHAGVFPQTYSEQINKKGFTKQVTFEEVKDVIMLSLELHGIDVAESDGTTEAIKLGLKDMNPERVLKFCEHLQIEMMNVSPLAQMVGLPTLGTKRISCVHANYVISGVDLDLTFDTFKKHNCNSCPHKKERPKDWAWSLEWERKNGKKYFLKFA